MIRLKLPFPPSVNHYWRHVGPRVLVSKKGRQYRADVTSLLHRKQLKTLEGDLIVNILLTPPDRRRRDVDNSLKALLDSMQFGGVYLDDSQIVRLTVEKLVADPDRPRADVIVQHVPALIGQAGYRSCLRCNVSFASVGPHNRICKDCEFINRCLPAVKPEERGQKFRNGEKIV